MDITNPIRNTLLQLTDTVNQLSDLAYKQPCLQLSGASIGEHCRHIMELFKELLTGYESGLICYEKRQRDLVLETNKEKAIVEIRMIINSIQLPDKKLVLSFQLDQDQNLDYKIDSNYYRELLYNLEHCVHHMALIRIGIKELTNLNLPDSFGVAASTIKHKNGQCAQ